MVSEFQRFFHQKKIYVDAYQQKLAFGLQKIFFGFQNLEKRFFQSGLNIERKIVEKKYQIQNQKQKMLSVCAQKFENSQDQINFFSEKIKYLNPEAILERGYSIVYDKDGKVVKKMDQLEIGEELSLRLSDALVKTEIKKISAL